MQSRARLSTLASPAHCPTGRALTGACTNARAAFPPTAMPPTLPAHNEPGCGVGVAATGQGHVQAGSAHYLAFGRTRATALWAVRGRGMFRLFVHTIAYRRGTGNMADVGKAVERLLKCVDQAVEATQNRIVVGNAQLNKCIDAYNDSVSKVETLWSRLQSRLFESASATEKGACANAWIGAHVDRKLHIHMEMMFIVVRDQAAAATATSALPETRCE